ncbi:hypothetical protein Glove_101g16 [Diversispora epigaea]|uniref:CP-type G domain-containing protein n=1 Tax=Diversispora epigaea TaxID=1348612 RepID=A0A397JAG2_9GLOM|nr:hypothetical protein Glove_101g16 [Diversispora epigaea]
MKPKSKKNTRLGKAIIRDRFKGHTKPKNGDTYLHTTELNDGASWTKLQSVTQQRDLDAFLSTAQLAGTQFTAEKLNIKVIANNYQNPFLPSSDKEKEILLKHEANVERLVIPRRPKWDKSTTSEQLEQNERNSFLQWRRDLAFLEENEEVILTPFERNLEVWRQLWRVIERSHLIAQIVDARNPLFFRSTDLEKYVKEVDDKKKNLLLINKADLLTINQRRAWADYLESKGIRYIFYSALESVNSKQEVDKLKEEKENESDFEMEENFSKDNSQEKTINQTPGIIQAENKIDKKDEEENEPETEDSIIDPRIRIATAEELSSLLITETQEQADPNHKLTIGLVGYPNVGKSSIINSLLGEKRVSVSSTPGKTKHFQTINLSSSLILCDCPGLVLPNFAITNADMICNGVLPIDQMREYTGPVALVTQRIPKRILEAIYGINIKIKSIDEGGTGIPTAEELLIAYASARGFFESGHGNPDQARSARYILKDYVNGKLPFCHPPPSTGISNVEFNSVLHDIKLYIKTKKNNPNPNNIENLNSVDAPITGEKSKILDDLFFNKQNSGPKIKGKFSFMGEFNRVQIYPTNAVNDNSNNPMISISLGKKHYKKNKKNKKT